MSKPILYTFQMSVWAAVPELALYVSILFPTGSYNVFTMIRISHRVELGYTDEDVEKKVINLVEGANFSPVFLEIVRSRAFPHASKPMLHLESQGNSAYSGGGR